MSSKERIISIPPKNRTKINRLAQQAEKTQHKFGSASVALAKATNLIAEQKKMLCFDDNYEEAIVTLVFAPDYLDEIHKMLRWPPEPGLTVREVWDEVKARFRLLYEKAMALDVIAHVMREKLPGKWDYIYAEAQRKGSERRLKETIFDLAVLLVVQRYLLQRFAWDKFDRARRENQQATWEWETERLFWDAHQVVLRNRIRCIVPK